MPQLLTPEEYQREISGGGFRADAPQADLWNLGGSAIDRAQAGLYGIAEAAGIESAGDLRRENQAESQKTQQRFYRDNPEQPQTWRDINGVASGLRYARNLGIESSPELATSLAALPIGGAAGLGALGRTALGAAMNAPSAMGDILQNQREEAGTTNLGTAAVLSVPYVAADMVGLEGALARGRFMRTGISHLDEMQGIRGGLARMGANGALNYVAEGAGETAQEMVNQLARINVNPTQTLFNQDANERYLESFIGGGMLGAGVSSTMGGWRRSEGYQPQPQRTVDDGQYDLTQPQGAPVAPTPALYNLTTQMDPLQARINAGLGIDRSKTKGYAGQFNAAFNEPSGVFVNDENGLERQLSVGELYQRQAELANPSVANTQQTAVLDDVVQLATDLGLKGVGKNGVKDAKRMELFTKAVELAKVGAIDDAMVKATVEVLNKGRYTEVATALKQADQEFTAKGAANGTPSAPVAPVGAGSVGTSPVADGSVVAGGPVAAVNGAGGGAAVNSGAAGNEAAPVGNTGIQSPTVVNTQQQGKTDPFQVSNQPSQTFELQDTSDDALEIARMTGNAGALEAMREDEEGLRADAPEQDQAKLGEDAQKIVDARFADSPTKERDVAIMRAYITAMNAAPHGSKMKIQQEIGRKYGVGADRVRQLGNPKELIRIGESMGYDGESVLAMFDTKNTAQAEASESGKLKYKLKQLDKQYKEAATELRKKRIAMLMGRTSEQLDKAQQKEEEARSAAVATGLKSAGVEFDAEEGSGMGGLDEDRFWQKESSTGSEATNTILRLSESIDQTRAAIAEFEAQGNTEVVAALETEIANKMARLQKLIDSINQKPAEPKREVAADLAAAKEKFKQVGRDVSKMEASELKLLRGEAERFKNKDLLAKIDAALGAAPAEEKAAPVAEEPKAEPVKEEPKVEEPKVLTPQEQYAELTKGFPVPAWGELTKVQQDKLTDLAHRDQLNLSAINRFVQAKAEETTTKEQREVAEDHAKDVGGTVAWQEGPLALIRGYSRMTGQPVYAVAKGTARSSVDVESFTGNAITPEEKAKLIEVKKQLEAADAEKHASAPFIKFDENGLAVSSGVDSRLAGVMAGWKKLLNIKSNIYITTLDDARADKDKFTGPHRAIGSAGLNANEAGSMRRMGDGFYIAFKKGTSYLKMLETLGHELGHVHEREAFDNAPAELKKAIRAEHDKFIQSQAGKTGKQFVEALRARAVGRATKGVDGMKAEELSSYWKSFSEWYADQVSKWATTSEKPVGVVEQFFAKLGAALKKFYYALKGEKYLPSETMKQFLDSVAARTLVIDGKVVNNDTSSQSLLAGPKSLKAMPSEDSADLRGHLVTAKLMDSNGESEQDIWNDTGWYKGGDGKWRYEIPDTMAEFKDTPIEKDTEYELGDILSHEWLFKAYPELAEYKIEFDQDLPPGNGMFNNDLKKIVMSWNNAYDMTTLLHEIQHAIQFREGFHLGGSKRIVNPKDLISLMKLAQANDLIGHKDRKLTNFIKAIQSGWNHVNDLYAETFKPHSQEQAMAAVERFQDAADAFDIFRDEEMKRLGVTNADLDKWAHAMYEQIYGEQESVVVESRYAMDPLARMGKVPRNPLPMSATFVSDPDTNTAYKTEAPTEGVISKNIAKLPKPVQSQARGLVSGLNRRIRKGLDSVVFTSDLVNRAVDAGIKSAKAFRDLAVRQATRARELEREVEKIADMYALVPEKDRQGDRSVNMFLRESTRQGKWGYDNNHKVKPDDAMKAWFDSLDAKSQAFIKAVFDHGDAMLKVKKDTVMKFTASEYDAHIKALEQMVNSGELEGEELAKVKAELATVKRDKRNDLSKFARLFEMQVGKPYAPIKRFGPYAVVAKSQEYMDAVSNKDMKKVRALEQSEDHYHVSFTESAAEAEALANALEEQGDYDKVQFFERAVNEDGLFGDQSMMQALTNLRARVNASDRPGTKQLQKLVAEMYLQNLAESSARKSEMRRRGVVGEVDMLRSFTSQGRADANFLAATQYGSQIQDAMQQMHKETREARDRTRASEVMNEVDRRYQQTFEKTSNPWLDKLRRMSSIYFLATSPAYYLQNLTQPWMMSVPAMTGRHDYTKIHAELGKAYAEMKDVVKSGGLLNQMFDYATVPQDVRKAIEELVNRGKIDIGMDTELGQFRVEGHGYFKDKINKIDKGLRLAIMKVESINRLSTAMTAYRLELAKGSSHEEALEYADRILTETHGDYTAFNAPRAFNTQAGKVALQFRKFQLLQLGYYAKLINDIFTNPKERAAAAKMLAYSLGHTAALAGVRGLPGFATLAWLAGKLFGDDDEPYDLEQSMRQYIGDEKMANLIMRGAPTLAGADISGKVGAGNMLSITPFSDADLSTRSGMAEWVGTLVGGASLGMAVREVDGLGQLLAGNYLRGMELMLPKGVGDAFKAYRIQTEGMTRRNGDVLLSPDEVSGWETTLQALGIQPVKQAVIYEKQQHVKDLDKNFQDRTTKIKSEYVRAKREGDSEAALKAQADWKKLQQVRHEHGYEKQPLSNLLKAPAEQKKREKLTIEGVQANKSNKKYVASLV